MRFFIRNKTKYNPEDAFKSAIVAVDVDHTQEIGKIKEEARKIAKGCKITALYVARHDGSFIDLADDRTINYYNLQDSMILETTSNPFWVTALYSNSKRREQEAASNPDNERLCNQAQQSIIHRRMAIGLLLNGTGQTEKQPPTFLELDDLYEYCMTKGKKPAKMSQFTVNELQEMLDAFQEDLINKRDPIGAFIYSQALKLGYLQEENAIDANDPFRSYFQQNADQPRAIPAARNNGRQNRNNQGVASAGRRRPNNYRICDDCEIELAGHYCGDCNPPLCLCDNCWMALHRGATRRNHQRRDLAEAPRQTSYIPQAYRAPFAMLVAFHRASQEQPQKLSLTADEIKSRGQPFTDTDLEEAKKRGKPFSGFDSLENALIKNEIVLKEAARTPKYSLQQSGQGLALKCSNFDFAVKNLLLQASVPTVPEVVRNPVLYNRQVCLLVDTEEPQKDRFVKYAQDRGLSVQVRKLPSGDFCWILLPPGAQANSANEMPDQELVLPFLVERKTWDDLWTSIRSPRFENQVQRMKYSGIQNLLYLVEGSPKELNGRPGPEIEGFLQGKLDRLLLEESFFVNRTPSWLKTVEWLCHLTHLATEYQRAGRERNLMTFSDFTRNANRQNVNNNRIAKPTCGIVWSADEFAENIRNHHTKGRDICHSLDHVPQLSRSVLIIQGLTAYNTNCHTLYKKTLADYLKVPGQTAEECVQIHLEDYTDQLVSVNVFQYFNLYLEVFKGIRIYRTETKEETQEFLSRFNVQNNVVAMMAHVDDNNDNNDGNGVNDNPQDEKIAERMDDDLTFANDSQEEQFMLEQALQQSLAEDNIPNTQSTTSGETSTVTYHEQKPRSSALAALPTNKHMPKNNSDPHVQNTTGGAKNTYPEQQTSSLVGLPKECTNNLPNNSAASNHLNSLPKDAEVKRQMTEEEYELQSILQFKLYDEIQSSLQENQDGPPDNDYSDSQDDELKKALEQSRLQYEDSQKDAEKMNVDQVSEERRDDKLSEDEQLQRALQESQQEYIRQQKNHQAKKETRKMSRDDKLKTALKDDEQLQKALEESRQQSVARGNPQENRVARIADNSDELKTGSEDGELQKALQESRRHYEAQQRRVQASKADVHEENRSELAKGELPVDEELKKALEESRKQHERQQRIAKFESKAKQSKEGNHATRHPSSVNSVGLDTSFSKKELTSKPKGKTTTSALPGRVDTRASADTHKDQYRENFDDEMEKALQESRQEYEVQKTKEKVENENYDEEEALRQALELSRKEMENEKMRKEEKSGNSCTDPVKDSLNVNDNETAEEKDAKIERMEIDSDQIGLTENNVRKENNSVDSNSNDSQRREEQEDFIEETQENNTTQENPEIFFDFEVPDFVHDNVNAGDILPDKTDMTSTPKTSNFIKSSLDSSSSCERDFITESSSNQKPSVPGNCIEPSSRSTGNTIATNKRVHSNSERNGNQDDHKSCSDVNGSCHGDDAILSDSCHGDDAILIDSQDYGEDDDDDNDDNNIIVHDEDNDATNFEKFKSRLNSIKQRYPTSDPLDSNDNDVIDSCHGDDAILIDSQDFNDDDSKDSDNDSNDDIRISSSCDSKSQTNSEDSGYQKGHRKPKTVKSPDTGLSFRQKAEAIARGKVSMMSLARSKESSPRQRPDKRGFDGKAKINKNTTSPTRSPRNAFSSTSKSTISSLTSHTTSPLSSSYRDDFSASKKARRTSDETLVFPSSNSSKTVSSSSRNSRNDLRKSPETFYNSSTNNISRNSSETSNLPSSFSKNCSKSSETSNENLVSRKTGKTCNASLVFPSSSPSPKPTQSTRMSSYDDIIMIDSQDDYQEVDSATDYEIARQLQEELNNEAKDYQNKGNHASSTKTLDSSNKTDSNRGSLVFPRSSQTTSTSNKRDASAGFTFPASSSCPSSSRLNSDDSVHGFTFPSSSSSSPRPPSEGTRTTSQSSSEFSKHTKGASAPKCSDCGEYGHRKGTKKCPYYYTEEAQRKREEQAQKRKEKREEEDRKQQEKVDALVAQHTQMAEEAEQIRRQIERFNRRNNHLPKMVEDVSKLLKKRRRK